MNERDKQTSKRRLLKLADYLDSLDPRRFDFSQIADGQLNECGTVGCAMGHMTQMKEFKRLGVFQTLGGFVYKRGTHDDRRYATGAFVVAMHVLKMTQKETDIFCPNGIYKDMKAPGNRATPKQVAKTIREFVKLYRS